MIINKIYKKNKHTMFEKRSTIAETITHFMPLVSFDTP